MLYAEGSNGFVSEKDWVRLIESMAKGDQRALQVLYDLTHRIVFTLSVRITNNRETAEEVTLDVFHDVWRRASTYDPAGGSVLGWIMNQAQSRAIDRVRFDRRKKRVNEHADSELQPTAARGPEETCELNEQADLVRNALTALKPVEREAIAAAFFSELTYSQVAARLQQPLGTVKTRVRSALGKLRQALARTQREA